MQTGGKGWAEGVCARGGVGDVTAASVDVTASGWDLTAVSVGEGLRVSEGVVGCGEGRAWGGGRGQPLWRVRGRSAGRGPGCRLRRGHLAAARPQTGQAGPHLGPQGLEPPQPLGQEGHGNTIVRQMEGQTLPGPAAPQPQAPSCLQGLFGSFGVQPSH